MSKNIQDIKGISNTYAVLLNEEGIDTTLEFLRVCGDNKGRKALAKKTFINEGEILRWTNMCDLYRINGVAGHYATLLEYTGVDTVNELRSRDADKLTKMMHEINEKKHFCNEAPSADTVSQWIEQAKQLDSMISY